MNNFEDFLKILCKFYINFSKVFAELIFAKYSHLEKFTLRKLLKKNFEKFWQIYIKFAQKFKKFFKIFQKQN